MINKLFTVLLFLGMVACTGPQNQDESSNTENLSSSKELDPALDVSSQNYVRADSARSQTLYIPVYSHIYQLNRRKTFNLTTTLSFRNIDLNRSVILTKVLYYDSDGNLVKNYLAEPKTIKPLASTSFVVEENDLRGGVGANFIVTWKAEKPISIPVVEAVMISTSQQQGISFVSKARVLENQLTDSLSSQ